MSNQELTRKMKVEISSVYGCTVTDPSVFRVIIPTLTDDEIIQKVREQIRTFYRYIMECDITNVMLQSGRTEGMLYAFFVSDRLSMKDYEKFTYAVDCMNNEFFGRYEVC